MPISCQPHEIEGFHSANMPLGLCAQIQAWRDQCHGTPSAGGASTEIAAGVAIPFALFFTASTLAVRVVIL
jgi:hypothetical protein